MFLKGFVFGIRGIKPSLFGLKKTFLFLLIFCPLKGFSHGSSHSGREMETALKIFEQALLLSPDFIEKTNPSSAITPYYKVNGHNIYLNSGFWLLTKNWLEVYIQEIEKYCPCDLSPDLLLEEAQNYVSQNLLANKGKEYLRTGVSISIDWTGRYGYTAALLKLSAEVAETILSLSVGFVIGSVPIHVACTAIDLMIIFLMRKMQRYLRAFSYGGKLKSGRLRTVVRTAWLFRKVKKARKKVFLYMDQALVFRQGELEKLSREGPGNRRLLWIESLKMETDSLFQQIAELEDLRKTASSKEEEQTFTKRIQKAQKKIERISKVKRKTFFGKAFKSFLKFRRGLAGPHLQDTILKRGGLWPLSLEVNLMERTFTPSLSDFTKRATPAPDEIRRGLAEEFLLKRGGDFSDKDKLERKSFLEELLWDIDQIFDTSAPPSYRLMKANSIEEFLGTTLLTAYFKASREAFVRKYNLSFKEQKQLQWVFARFLNLFDSFSDFLNVIATIKDKKKIQFYKYESMEKLLAFFDYVQEVQSLLADSHPDKQALFENLKSKHRQLQTISLLKEKKTVSGLRKKAYKLTPFVQNLPRCQKLVERYQ